MTDFEKKVDFSTFLNDGNILLKIGFRFLIFNEFGEFIDETDFKNSGEESLHNINQIEDGQNAMRTIMLR